MSQKLISAIKVVLLTAPTRAHLMKNGPQCLKQLTEAINDAGSPLTADQIDAMNDQVQEHLTDAELAEYQRWAAMHNVQFKRPTFSGGKYWG